MEGAWPGQEADALEHGLTLAAFSPGAVTRLEKAAAKRDSAARVHVKVDTGMSRLGVHWKDLAPLLAALRAAPHVRVAGAFTHLAAADEDPAFTREQALRFAHALRDIRSSGLEPGEIHLANSAGLLQFPEFSWLSARPGIAVYGYTPVKGGPPDAFQPVLTLKSRVGRLHRVAAGESVGYNRRFCAARDTLAATIPAGYADGYRRGLSGKAKVIVHDTLADIIGTVSMDMIVADVTHLPDLREGRRGHPPRREPPLPVRRRVLGPRPRHDLLRGPLRHQSPRPARVCGRPP